MRIVLKVWLPIMAAAAVLALAYLVLNWSTMTTTHRISFIALILIVAHIHEEERFPGGFGYMFNVVRANSDVPDRYPMSPLIAMLVDVGVIFALFVPALFLPHIIWLAMAPMFLLIMELMLHGGIGVFLQWRRLGISIYNPALATAFLMAALATTFIVVAVSDGLMTGRDWLFAVLYYIATMIIFLGIPEYGMRSKTTRWAFARNHFLGYYKRYTTVEEVFGSAAPHPAKP